MRDAKERVGRAAYHRRSGKRVITVAVKPDDLQDGDEADPNQHPIAIALRRQRGIDNARVSKREVLIRRGDQWFRYGAPKRVT